jgi:hypothetical protein
MKRLIAAVSLAVLAGPAFAVNHEDTVANPQDCPAGTSAHANYEWRNGGFVREGWACRIDPSH